MHAKKGAEMALDKIKEEKWADLSLQERTLLHFFRNELKYGEAQVIVRNGYPVFVRIAYKDVKLD